MIGGSAFKGRLKSRWRKWRRDPASFADDLPWPALRALALRRLALAALLEEALDGRTRAARRAWRLAGVALRPTADGTYAFLGEDGGAPQLWPRRLRIAPAAPAAVVAFSEGGGVMAAAEVAPGRPGVLALSGPPAVLRVYPMTPGAHAREHLAVEPLGRAGLVRLARNGGAGLAEALKSAWPPQERRAATPSAAAYRAWIARNEPSSEDAGAIRAWLRTLGPPPVISVLMPVRDPPPGHLLAAIASVREQIHHDWRLCIADDGSESAEVRAILREAAEDPRVRLARHEAPEGVAAATNAALAMAEGDVALFLDHDDILAPHALALVAGEFAHRPDAVAVYSDEDTIDAEGRRSAPAFKPDFDAERLLAHNYVNHLFAVRLPLLRRLGGIAQGVDGAQDHDLVLRVAEADEGPIVHVPHVLYHWRSYPGGASLSQARKAWADEARLKVLRARLERRGERASLSLGPRGRVVVHRDLPQPAPEVLAVIPTRDRPGLLAACAAGLLDRTDYPALKVCIVDNGGVDPDGAALLAGLARDPRVRVLRVDAPFNFSALNNAAVAHGAESLLAFINDDVMVAEPDWLRRMAALAVLADVGAVGAKLFYPDGRLQHAGVVLGLGPQGVAGHEFRGAPGDEPGPQDRLLVTRQASAVTAACMVVERRKFEAVGGFDEAAFPVAFNDVDLCLKLGARGWRTIWTPHAALLHLESATRGAEARSAATAARFAAEAARIKRRWGRALGADPFYNPNLTLEDESFGLAAASRAPAPWRD